MGPPRTTADGVREFAIPLEFNPRECGVRDAEEILKRNVKYPSDLMEEEDPDATEDKDDNEELIADLTAKEKEIEELKRKLEELKQQMNNEEDPIKRRRSRSRSRSRTREEIPEDEDNYCELIDDN